MAGPRRGGRSTGTAPGRRLSPLRCIAIALAAVVVVAGLAVLIFWLAVRPAPVEYTVDGASVRGFNITARGNALNATFDLTLRADNRRNRKVALYYDSFEVAVWYGEQVLAFTEAAPFFQPRRNATRIEAAPAAREAPLLPDVARYMKQDRSAGELPVEVRVRARIRFKVGVVKTRHYMLRVYCPQVIIKLSSPTSFDRVYCDVDI